MVGYNYKLQWVFDTQKDAFAVIRAIGSRSLDVVNIRDSITEKVLESYNGFTQYKPSVADDKTIAFITKARKKFGDRAVYIELLRR